jgi:hypothetical protein
VCVVLGRGKKKACRVCCVLSQLDMCCSCRRWVRHWAAYGLLSQTRSFTMWSIIQQLVTLMNLFYPLFWKTRIHNNNSEVTCGPVINNKTKRWSSTCPVAHTLQHSKMNTISRIISLCVTTLSTVNCATLYVHVYINICFFFYQIIKNAGVVQWWHSELPESFVVLRISI